MLESIAGASGKAEDTLVSDDNESINTFNTLPQDLYNKIFSYLSKNDLQNVAQTTKDLKVGVQNAVNYSEPASIKEFVTALIKRLNPEIFSNQRNTLTQISQNITPQNFTDLQPLREYILEIKGQLINVIKTLDVKVVRDLRDNISTPHFMKNIFGLAVFEKRIEAANINDMEAKADALIDISTYLIESACIDASNIDRAIEVALSIPIQEYKERALMDISEILINTSNIDVNNINRSIEVALLIYSERTKAVALSAISNVLSKFGNLDRAIEVIKLIPDLFAGHKAAALSNVSIYLMHTGNRERAVEVALSIPSEVYKINTLTGISRVLRRAGKIDQAVEVEKLISLEKLFSDT